MPRKKKDPEKIEEAVPLKASELPPPKMGRPSFEVDKEQFEKLCQIQATIREMAGWFRCCDDTLERWAKKTYGKTLAAVRDDIGAQGKISLRRTMFQNALKGNTQLLVFLAKNELGMSDSREKILVPFDPTAKQEATADKPTEGKTRDELQGYIEAKLAGG